jgi:hypothetical protein
MFPALFARVIFQVGFHIYAWVSLDHDSPIYTST